MRLAGKSAIITGAGSGMGKAMAERFAAEGAHVLCADISGAQDTVARDIGNGAIGLRVDVSSEDDIKAMVATAEERFGRLDILVNNAGFGGGMIPLHEQTAENWDRIHDVNVRGVFLGMKYAIAAMLRGGGGNVLNISSASGVVGWRKHSVYGAAKAGVNQLTRAAALDYATQNIRVNAIAPGTFWTGLVPQSKDHAEPPEGIFIVPGIPMNRWGAASEIANAALFLTSDEASYITGVVLPVDGGYCIGYSGLEADRD